MATTTTTTPSIDLTPDDLLNLKLFGSAFAALDALEIKKAELDLARTTKTQKLAEALAVVPPPALDQVTRLVQDYAKDGEAVDLAHKQFHRAEAELNKWQQSLTKKAPNAALAFYCSRRDALLQRMEGDRMDSEKLQEQIEQLTTIIDKLGARAASKKG